MTTKHTTTPQSEADKRAKRTAEIAHIMSCRKAGCTRCDPAYSR